MSGRDKEYDSDDPMELVGMVIDGDDGSVMEEMGRTYIDEFIRMGYPDIAIVRLFRDPFYRAPHALYVRKGEAYIVEMIHDARTRQAH